MTRPMLRKYVMKYLRDNEMMGTGRSINANNEMCEIFNITTDTILSLFNLLSFYIGSSNNLYAYSVHHPDARVEKYSELL